MGSPRAVDSTKLQGYCWNMEFQLMFQMVQGGHLCSWLKKVCKCMSAPAVALLVSGVKQGYSSGVSSVGARSLQTPRVHLKCRLSQVHRELKKTMLYLKIRAPHGKIQWKLAMLVNGLRERKRRSRRKRILRMKKIKLVC